MSEENVEIVRAAFAALNRRDFDAALAFVAPDCEFDMSRAVGPDRSIYNVVEWRALAQTWFDTWESSQWEVLEYIDGKEHVVTPVRNRLRGRGGIDVQARVTWLCTLRNGAIQRLAIYQERAEALKAAGLSE